MLSWLFAAAVASTLAFLQYRFGGTHRATVPLVLRATALTIVIALLFDAPIGPAGSVRACTALDASASWLASGDGALWQRAVKSADSVGADSLLLIGDSVRVGKAPTVPVDGASRTAPLLERALGAGRPVTLITDGRVDDPERLKELPSGSHVIVLEAAPKRDRLARRSVGGRHG
jgi:hypothetical protein